MIKLKRVKSLRVKCYSATILAVALLCCVAMLTTYLIHSYTLDSRYKKLQTTVAQTVRGMVDTGDAEGYMNGGNIEEHIKNSIRFRNLVDDIGDIHSIGMYKFTENGMYVVFDTTSEKTRDGVGEFYKYTKEWESKKEHFLEGETIDEIVITYAEGKTAVYCIPVAKTDDNGYFYICVGVLKSLTDAMSVDFFAKNSASIILVAIAFLLLAGVYIELEIIKPINSIAKLVKRASDENDNKLIDVIMGANIKAAGEIENINRSLIKIYTAKVRLGSAMAKVKTNSTSAILSIIKRMDNFSALHFDNSLQYIILLASAVRKVDKYKKLMTKKDYDDLLLAAPLHDIGKLVIPDNILNKPGALTDEEYEVVKEHTVLGAKIVEELHADNETESYLEMARQIVKYHHERWDGNGYPEGLKGEEIPLAVRIVTVADVFDSLVSKRVYKEAYSFEKAFAMIVEERGKAFDPEIVDIFVSLKKKIYDLYMKIGNH